MQHNSIIWPNPWYSDKDRVWIHSETCTWHDKNIQSNATQLNHLASFTKLFSVHLRTKWLWIWVSLQSLKLQILCLFRARSSLTFRQIYSVDSLWNAYVICYWWNVAKHWLGIWLNKSSLYNTDDNTYALRKTIYVSSFFTNKEASLK